MVNKKYKKNKKYNKILIIGDTHGSMAEFLAIKKLEKPELIIHTGDFNDKSGNGTVLTMEEAKKHFDIFVKGNHYIGEKTLKDFKDKDDYEHFYDRMEKTNPHYFFDELMNDNEIFYLNGKSFLLMHSYYFAKDAVTNYKNYDWDIDADIIDILKKRWFNKTRILTRGDKKIDYIISGHTHCPAITKRNREDKDSCIVNPGSPVLFQFFMNKGSYVIGT
jgi:putative phosphoesterase